VKRALGLVVAFAWLTLCWATALAADPYLELEVIGTDGTPQSGISVTYYVGDVAKPGVTDQYGKKAWPLRGEGTRLSITGHILEANATGARAWIEGEIIQVRWDSGTQVVRVLARVSQLAPTATPTQGPTKTLYPTMTAGPTPTPLVTELPPVDLPWVLIEVEGQTHIPGRFTYRWLTGNGAHAQVWSGSADAWVDFVGKWHEGLEASDRVRWIVWTDPALYPPTVVVVTPTGAATKPPTATGTATRTPTPQPTLTPWIVTATPAIWEDRLAAVVRDASDMGVTLHITPVYEWNDLGR
jgi:hypothetical protein